MIMSKNLRHFLEKEKLLCCESLPSPHPKGRKGNGRDLLHIKRCVCVCVCWGGGGCVPMGQRGKLERIPYILEINSQKN